MCNGRSCLLDGHVYWTVMCTGRSYVLDGHVYWMVMFTGRSCIPEGPGGEVDDSDGEDGEHPLHHGSIKS